MPKRTKEEISVEKEKEKLRALGRSTQHRGAGRRSADENLMFEGIGSNSQQAGLRICRTNALLANL